MKPKLLFTDENAALVYELQGVFDGVSELSTLVLPPQELPKLDGLDALYVTFMTAERWRSKLVFYESQVIKTRPEDRGWPPYVVTGIALKPNDPRAGNLTEELKLVMKAVLDAVSAYNQQNNSPIRRVGFWIDTLWINRMDVAAAGKIIRSAYQERYP